MKNPLTPERLNALEALVGLALIAGGVAWYSGPAALILVGLVLFGAAIWPHLGRR